MLDSSFYFTLQSELRHNDVLFGIFLFIFLLITNSFLLHSGPIWVQAFACFMTRLTFDLRRVQNSQDAKEAPSHWLKIIPNCITCTVIQTNNHSHWKITHLYIIQSLRNPEMNSLCDGALWVTRQYRSQSKVIVQLALLPQEVFCLPALISDSFHPLSSQVYDITWLFPHSEADFCPRLLLHTHSCVCALAPLWVQALVWAPTHFSDLTWILTPQPSHEIALLRSLNKTWIQPVFIKSDNMTFTFSIQQHCYPSIYLFWPMKYNFLVFCRSTKKLRFAPKLPRWSGSTKKSPAPLDLVRLSQTIPLFEPVSVIPSNSVSNWFPNWLHWLRLC